MAEALARLGATVPFREAAGLAAVLLGVATDEATVRRYTYGAGDAALAAEAAALHRALADPQTVADAPACLQLSLDATKVPLVGGDWTDVKLAVIGAVVPGPPDEDGRPTARTERVSYVARWEPAARFGQTLTLEAQRRGVDEAAVVVSPNDGAEWIQGNLDLVAPQAVRILDFPHAVEHLGAVAAPVYGEGSPEATAWVATRRRALLASGAAPLLAALAACQERGPCASARPDAEGRTPAELLAREVAYFARRAPQLDYPAFRQRGWPSGSGCVESGHKVVTGARPRRPAPPPRSPHPRRRCRPPRRPSSSSPGDRPLPTPGASPSCPAARRDRQQSAAHPLRASAFWGGDGARRATAWAGDWA
jgi:hypothetical protein